MENDGFTLTPEYISSATVTTAAPTATFFFDAMNALFRSKNVVSRRRRRLIRVLRPWDMDGSSSSSRRHWQGTTSSHGQAVATDEGWELMRAGSGDGGGGIVVLVPYWRWWWRRHTWHGRHGACDAASSMQELVGASRGWFGAQIWISNREIGVTTESVEFYHTNSSVDTNFRHINLISNSRNEIVNGISTRFFLWTPQKLRWGVIFKLIQIRETKATTESVLNFSYELRRSCNGGHFNLNSNSRNEIDDRRN